MCNSSKLKLFIFLFLFAACNGLVKANSSATYTMTSNNNRAIDDSLCESIKSILDAADNYKVQTLEGDEIALELSGGHASRKVNFNISGLASPAFIQKFGQRHVILPLVKIPGSFKSKKNDPLLKKIKQCLGNKVRNEKDSSMLYSESGSSVLIMPFKYKGAYLRGLEINEAEKYKDYPAMCQSLKSLMKLSIGDKENKLDKYIDPTKPVPAWGNRNSNLLSFNYNIPGWTSHGINPDKTEIIYEHTTQYNSQAYIDRCLWHSWNKSIIPYKKAIYKHPDSQSTIEIVFSKASKSGKSEIILSFDQQAEPIKKQQTVQQKVAKVSTNSKQTPLQKSVRDSKKKYASSNSKCIKGNCTNGTGSIKLNNGAVITGKFVNGKVTGPIEMDLEGKNPAIYNGTIDPNTYAMEGKGTYLFKKTNILMTSQFYQGKPSGNSTILYKNFDFKLQGYIKKGISFTGSVAGSIKTKKDDSQLLKKLSTKGYFENGKTLKDHVLKFCITCPPAVTVNYDAQGTTKQTSLYGENGVVHKVVTAIRNEHTFLQQAIAGTKKQAKKSNIPIINDKKFTCGHECKTKYSASGSVHTNDIRVYIAAPRQGLSFKVKLGGLKSRKCIVKDGFCTIEIKTKGTTSNKLTIEGEPAIIPYEAWFMVGGHKVKKAPPPKPKSTVSTYISVSDVEDVVTQVMKGKSHKILWSLRKYVQSSGTEMYINDEIFAGSTLKPGKYRVFVYEPNSGSICLQWYLQYDGVNPSTGQRGTFMDSSKKACGNKMKLTKGNLSNILYQVPASVMVNKMTFSGISDEVIIVLVREY